MGRSTDHIRSIVAEEVEKQVLPLFQSAAESRGDQPDLPAGMLACCNEMQNKLDGIKSLIMDHCDSKSKEEEEKEEKIKDVIKSSIYKYIRDWLNTDGAGDKIEEIFQYFIEHAPEYALDLGDFVLDLAKILYYAAQFTTLKLKLDQILRKLRDLENKPNDMAKCCEEVKEQLKALSDDHEDIIRSLSVLHQNTEQCCEYIKSYLIEFQHNVLQGQIDTTDPIQRSITNFYHEAHNYYITYGPKMDDLGRKVDAIKDDTDTIKGDTSDLKDGMSEMGSKFNECCTKIQNELAAIRGSL